MNKLNLSRITILFLSVLLSALSTISLPKGTVSREVQIDSGCVRRLVELSPNARSNDKKTDLKKREEEETKANGKGKEETKTNGKGKEETKTNGKGKEETKANGKGKEETKANGKGKEETKANGKGKEETKVNGKGKEEEKGKDKDKEGKKEEENGDKLAGNKFELPYGCEEQDISKKLTRRELINLTNSCGNFMVTKKEAYLLFYYHRMQLMAYFNNMVYKLSNVLTELAKQYGMSEKDKIKCWSECYDTLLLDLKEMEETSQKHCENFLKKKLMLRIHFDCSLMMYNKLWDDCIRKNTKKWNKYFNEKAMSCKQKSSESTQ
ncbi:RAD protein (Pv-fam-e) [Plasmodium ovale wallikeri]|uniref:RAD protein (Pv-fam-e) n=1 Tax=Plasmodium ovale wallikeri TaxID=864142 RepID=A0A1A8YL28_PLAOA|nr:RAD protein (Pv-fam-e) [Plasmodium ovale wallikeri]